MCLALRVSVGGLLIYFDHLCENCGVWLEPTDPEECPACRGWLYSRDTGVKYEMRQKPEITERLQCTGFDRTCGSHKAKRRRQNTQYADEERNWVVMCNECFAENEKYWSQEWADFWSNCL